MRIFDISQRLGTATAVWPGDAPFRLAWTSTLAGGGSANVAALSLSAHAGTHLDGFGHVGDIGVPIGDLDLEPCLGPAVVVDARGREAQGLGPELLHGIDPARTPRVLFRTRDVVDETRFPGDVAWVTAELARALVERGFRLVGTDSPSLDPLDSESLPAHRTLAAGGVLGLENLVLTQVPPGGYILVALPLRLMEADSSPVRAVLLDGWPGAELPAGPAAADAAAAGAADGRP